MFSKIDLASGFHQIEVFPPYRELTAFILPEDCRWTISLVMEGNAIRAGKCSFYLSNEPCQLHFVVVKTFAVVYIDDILVFSNDRDKHLQHFRRVFAALQSQSYYIRLSKYCFFASEVPFLEHILTPDSIKAADKRFRHIQSFPTPFSTPNQVRSFLGMVMWYRAFIPHIATIAAPLFPLTSVEKGFSWTPEAEQSVAALKHALTGNSCLSEI